MYGGTLQRPAAGVDRVTLYCKSPPDIPGDYQGDDMDYTPYHKRPNLDDLQREQREFIGPREPRQQPKMPRSGKPFIMTKEHIEWIRSLDRER